jgi:hypothetical protein
MNKKFNKQKAFFISHMRVKKYMNNVLIYVKNIYARLGNINLN